MCLFSLLCLSVHLHSGLVMMHWLNCEIKMYVQEEPRVNRTCDGATKCQKHPLTLWRWQDVSVTTWQHEENSGEIFPEIFPVEIRRPHLSRTQRRRRSSAQQRCWGNISPSEHCSAQSVITGGAVTFMVYIWMNYRWLVTLAALNECSSQNANVATAQAHMKDAFYLQSPGFLYLPYGLKGCIFWLTVSNPNSDS